MYLYLFIRSLPSACSSFTADNSKELNEADLAWYKDNLPKESSEEPRKKKPRSVSRDLCYVTVNYESSVCCDTWLLKKNAAVVCSF